MSNPLSLMSFLCYTYTIMLIIKHETDVSGQTY